ncbi:MULTISPECIES: ParB/RepB/Spo0J family partition protein [Burkholderiales]|jgi:ParB family chromosome partitioning protein|uniref:ParB family protein n=3 Tax=Pseudomonadota TaxID=1224 RepID=A0A1H3SR26_9BURK|nr:MULTISPECIES: ParB/RepB/Spo0J family partition protein [Burkholderiales]MAY25952.1 chromosome partitioning protein ParB [Polycyclovorans sp.]MBV5525163.1 ParB/RepB/Spo0J family partition protein [Pseudomonas aeruginosa]TAM87014.1 MAG: ParB/RepB/Spo0J family partition protein [Candidimonas sp.]MBN8753862.1 ParB/RepB/Spo0J family partition protein [Variovorax sp.]MBV5542227.1 ParB/RepB/Spo0J family partition protein [Pseudomonas aeruginosa]|tara:strand:- start:17 stop:2056 length:2040 start_codon:yes stop_codon:yes gene_type:complete|mmetsp:Transcript_5956/g.23576  ORF Transcript_5956/g.23576 Transcript_5956/m.23576 type:complete len:680 (-) Transcript_5956:2885-4924(-)
MNAVTYIETQALDTRANVLQAADPSKHMILVPLSRLVLRPTGRNVRKAVPRMSIPELAASIQRVGLLQNLIVIPAADGLHYEVVAGGRRLAALKLLAKKHRIAKDWDVPCLQVADGTARTASLTENVQREAMHPADQFEAFAALVAEGRPIEDIAADFSVTPLVVQRRLKLANVSPRLMADYRADAVSLDQLMALSITDDHAAQESAFYDAPQWQRQPSALRERLTEREIDAYHHPLVRFVGLDSYEAAGGGIRRDLFAEGDTGVYLTDAALLERLAQDKLAGIAAEVKAEGWAWADATPGVTHADLHAFQRAPRERREPNKREAQRIEKLQAKMQEVAEAVDAAVDAEDEDKADALQEEGERLGEQLQALEDGLQGYAANVKAAAGAIVTIDRNGEAVIHRGLLREAEAKALRTLEKLRLGFSGADAASDDEGEEDEAPKAAAISDRLAQRLSAHRTAALQIEVAQHPQVALAALMHGMVQTVLRGRYYGHDLPLGVRLTVQDRLEGMAPDWPESPAAVALRELQEAWSGKLPEDSAELFAALLAMEQGELVKLLAVCVASTVDVVTPRATAQQPGAELAQAVGLDMAAWWKPTAEGYFKHVPKVVVLQAVGEFAPESVNRLAKLKKADIASEAERLVNGKGWMPAIFKTEDGPEKGPQDGAEEVATEADEPTEVLAA